jgi:anaerobic selenocysteine-containing dehydrogenase
MATVRDGRLERLEPDRDHPVSKGFVCNKGIYGLDVHNDPDRLRVPLRRTASGGFEEISWDTALAEISARLTAVRERHGADAIGSYTGNPTAFNSLYGPAFGNFMRQLGAGRHFSSGTQDCSNKFAGSQAVFGTRTLHPVPDLENADFILLIGENPAVSHMSFVSLPNPMQLLKDAEARGARVLYVNPRRIESASIAGEVLKIRPDTDVYLLAALVHEIDTGPGFAPRAEMHGDNLDALRAFVSSYPAERVAGVTGISADQIRALARDLAAAERACFHMSTGVNMGRQGTLAYWLLQMLTLVTGNLGRRGGNFYSLGFYERAPAAGRSAPEDVVDGPFGPMRRPGGVGISLPGNLLADYLTADDNPLRALFVNSGNPVLSIAGEERMRAALDGLELLVCVDIYPNATAEHAHYVLPAAGAFEREDINITGLGLQYQPSVQFTPAVVPPAYERRPEWWIFDALSRHMGFEPLHDEQGSNVWARTDAMLRSRGRSMAELRDEQIIVIERAEPEDFYERFLQRPDQRVQCFPPEFEAAIERMADLFDELDSEPANQLKLISKRDAYMLNSWYANVAKLKKAPRDRNYLFMHPEDAAARQIGEDTVVRISSRFGRIESPVKLTDDLMPGVVAMTHGWGHGSHSHLSVARETPGSNPNRLLPSGPGSFEPLSNQSHMTGIPVDVVPA